MSWCGRGGAASRHLVRAGCIVILLGGVVTLAACHRSDAVQRGFRGTGMMQVYKAGKKDATLAELNTIPPPEDPADEDSPTAAEVFKNVRVLNDLSATNISRLMQAMATWVAPDEGCDFCHNANKLEADEKYTKIVARRMLQMTRHINSDWKAHVGSTGVTCWTCHRGQAVPSGDWFANPGPQMMSGSAARFPGKNLPSANAGGSALPLDPLSVFLTAPAVARIQGTAALAGENRHSVKQSEWTYSFMIYIAQSLGVNCTYCHNTQSMGRWEVNTPQRATAWHGIQMVRDLNTAYLIPLKETLPPNRYSDLGDGPKIGCATCHKGTFKPLYGVTMLDDYPVLRGVTPALPPVPATTAAPANAKPPTAAAPTEGMVAAQ